MMKRLFKKNQVIFTSLALMIAVAGYLNYSDKIFGEKSHDVGNDLLDISMEDEEIIETPGEAVLTSQRTEGFVAQAKLTKDQNTRK